MFRGTVTASSLHVEAGQAALFDPLVSGRPQLFGSCCGSLCLYRSKEEGRDFEVRASNACNLCMCFCCICYACAMLSVSETAAPSPQLMELARIRHVR